MTGVPTPLRQRLLRRTEQLGLTLGTGELGQIEQYLLLLERWNRSINLTALPLSGFPDRTLDRLIMESLVAAAHVEDSSLMWLDLGSGGGSPAIPLKIVRQRLNLTMVESRARKGAFLRQAIQALGLDGATVLTVRLEQLATKGFSRSADLVTVRALRIDEATLSAIIDLLRNRGRLFLFRAKSAPIPVVQGLRRTDEIRLPSATESLQVWERSGP